MNQNAAARVIGVMKCDDILGMLAEGSLTQDDLNRHACEKCTSLYSVLAQSRAPEPTRNNNRTHSALAAVAAITVARSQTRVRFLLATFAAALVVTAAAFLFVAQISKRAADAARPSTLTLCSGTSMTLNEGTLKVVQDSTLAFERDGIRLGSGEIFLNLNSSLNIYCHDTLIKNRGTMYGVSCGAGNRFRVYVLSGTVEVGSGAYTAGSELTFAGATLVQQKKLMHDSLKWMTPEIEIAVSERDIKMSGSETAIPVTLKNLLPVEISISELSPRVICSFTDGASTYALPAGLELSGDVIPASGVLRGTVKLTGSIENNPETQIALLSSNDIFRSKVFKLKK